MTLKLDRILSMVDARPDIWMLTDMTDSRMRIPKPTTKKIPEKKVLWIGGPWNGLLTSIANDAPEVKQIGPMLHSWKQVTTKLRIGFVTEGMYERIAVNAFRWRTTNESVAWRELSDDMIPKKKVKVAEE